MGFDRNVDAWDILEHFHPLSTQKAGHDLKVTRASYDKNVRKQFRKAIYVKEDLGDLVLIGLKDSPKWTKKQTKEVLALELGMLQGLIDKIKTGLSEW